VRLKKLFIKAHQFTGLLGVDPLIFLRTVRGIPMFLRELLQFRRGYSGRLDLMPFLHERYAEGGATKNEYFWQDLLVARCIFEAKPQRHVDIGSSVEGFVAHVASFREVEVYDVRPITTGIPGVVFKRADAMESASLPESYCDSLSCLHAIEHFGLGRYGDPIEPQGHERGIANMSKLLKPGGTFYLSAPIGQERVIFNANRVFDPRTILRCAEINGLHLNDFTLISSRGEVEAIQLNEVSLQQLGSSDYNLGVFVFKKK
jgi:hypothetical protein